MNYLLISSNDDNNNKKNYLSVYVSLLRAWGDLDVNNFTPMDISARKEVDCKRQISSNEKDVNFFEKVRYARVTCVK